MSCIQFEEIVHDLDRPGTAGAALREAALAHAESCARCAQLLTETESLDQALHVIATAAIRREAPAWMETALLREFRYARAAAPKSSAGRRIAALVIAAAVLLAAGVSLLRFELAPKSTTVATVAPRGSKNQTEVAQNAADSTASDFMALPYADDPDGVEGGTVVRVELSGTALASLGLPVSLTGSSATISADLLVSDDGTPQAIRLVSQEGEAGAF